MPIRMDEGAAELLDTLHSAGYACLLYTSDQKPEKPAPRAEAAPAAETEPAESKKKPSGAPLPAACLLYTSRRNCSTGEDAGYPRQDGKTPWSFTVA